MPGVVSKCIANTQTVAVDPIPNNNINIIMILIIIIITLLVPITLFACMHVATINSWGDSMPLSVPFCK